jgi:Mrp family chromosome partitioning ATPase
MALSRLIFVTGKGGSGKSTVAAALAAVFSLERPTVLVDLDGRLSAARMLGIAPNGSAPASTGASLEVAGLTPHAELEAFIERIVPLKAISRRMLKSRTFGHVTAALPGLEAFLMLERLRIMAREIETRDGLVVVDAPATGGAMELLSVTRQIRKLAPLGTLNRLAAAVEEMITDPARFGVVLTAMPQELAVREALEAAASLNERLGLTPIAAVLNGVADALFRPAELNHLDALGAHAWLARRRLEMAQGASRARRELIRAGLRVVELPMMFEPAIKHDHLVGLGLRLEAAMLKP